MRYSVTFDFRNGRNQQSARRYIVDGSTSFSGAVGHAAKDSGLGGRLTMRIREIKEVRAEDDVSHLKVLGE